MPLFTPIGGGGIGKATVTSTTGSPTVDTTSRPGKTIYKWTGTSGSITIGTAGTAEILVVAGGGGSSGAGGGGGAGGCLYETSAYLPAGTHTIVVGAGGTSANQANSSTLGQNGKSSRLGSYYAVGGGGSAVGGNWGEGLNGGSGGGGNYYSGAAGGAGGSGVSGQGNDGGQPGTNYLAGGGGAGGAGSGGNGTGVAGPGRSIDITGTAVTYATGGQGNGTTATAANLGNGAVGNSARAGGSGIVIVVVG